MTVEALNEVVGQDPFLVRPFTLVQDQLVQPGDDGPDFAAFPSLEDGVREVKHESLDKNIDLFSNCIYYTFTHSFSEEWLVFKELALVD